MGAVEMMSASSVGGTCRAKNRPSPKGTFMSTAQPSPKSCSLFPPNQSMPRSWQISARAMHTPKPVTAITWETGTPRMPQCR